jgi:type II secretory ATPase GspE/PulE/Tfp pilus assembly ATPase PilB-like protein
MEAAAQIRFWQALAQEMAKGAPMTKGLEAARAAVSDAPFVRVADSLIKDARQGTLLSQSMASHETIFPRSLVAMAQAGEAGGVLAVIASRIAEALQDGTFRLPEDPPAGRPMARFWREFGRLLGSGVPIVEALGLLQEEMAATGQPTLATAAGAARDAIPMGRTLAQALGATPDAFDPRVLGAVAVGESTGELDIISMKIADAVDKDALGDLPQGPAQATTANTEAAKTLREILAEALRSRASDVAIESLEGGRVRLRQRIDGVMHEMRMLPEGSARPLVAHVKAMGNLDLAEWHLPQDGRIQLKIEGQDIDVRLSIVPAVYGERVMMRLLWRQAVALGLDKVGLSKENLATVRRFAHMPQGIVVVNGATGTGKTTLLYSMLLEIDAVANNIITVEDPVEYAFDRFTQIQIKPEIGLTFSRAIRSLLRQAPNVLMIGEIRDQEMLQMAVQSAMTGHLVLTTLHATTSPGAIRRMLDIGVAPFMVNASLLGVISQKLVRLLCPDCKQPTKMDEALLPAEAREALQSHKDVTWFGPKGCPACTSTGYRGMIAIHEVLVMDDTIRQVVSTDPTATQIRQAALGQGMKSMLQDGLAKAAQGMTSVEEILRVAPQETHL